MRYFTIMTGLRGCYIPDGVYTIEVSSKTELLAALRDELRDQTDHEGPSRTMFEKRGLNCREAAAELWRRKPTDRDAYLSTVIPYGKGAAFGIQVNPINRAEYLDARDNASD